MFTGMHTDAFSPLSLKATSAARALTRSKLHLADTDPGRADLAVELEILHEGEARCPEFDKLKTSAYRPISWIPTYARY